MNPAVRFPPATVYIETGLGHGDSLRAAIQQQHYQRLYAIEIDPDLVAAGRCTFTPGSRIVLLHGDSATLLPAILDPTLPTTFWLDAHYSAGEFSGDADRDRRLAPVCCPLLAELAAITACRWTIPPQILIDDAVLFDPNLRRLESHYTPADYTQVPTTAAIAAALPGYTLTTYGADRGRYLHAQVLSQVLR